MALSKRFLNAMDPVSVPSSNCSPVNEKDSTQSKTVCMRITIDSPFQIAKYCHGILQGDILPYVQSVVFRSEELGNSDKYP